jgi:hypothetical protein
MKQMQWELIPHPVYRIRLRKIFTENANAV